LPIFSGVQEDELRREKKEKRVEFRVDVDANWVVRVTNLQTQKPVVDASGKAYERTLGKVGDDLKSFPQPPDEEAKKIAADSLHYELCTTKDEQVIEGIYQGLLRREAKDVEKFGRYLFATLLGEELWQAINEEAKTAPVELALNWKDDYLFNRLPWEMMHSQQRFLAAEREVAITRRVAGTTQTLSKIAAPRVLFVVGSDLAKDDQIKPGAEYLGLLRSLNPAARFRLKTHLLLEASPKRLRAAIKWFKPTVVHFICHGFPNQDQETRLRLMADEGGGVQDVNADSLLKMLRPDPTMALPQIVILNACYSAANYNVEMFMKSGQVSSPIAVKLVAGDGESPGVPIVVGMAGEVADQACRLFTRCFYEAILDGGEIAQAASAGRRLGIIEEGLTDPTDSIDWALPTLFMSASVTEPKLEIIANPNEEAWHAKATQFAPADYPAFCDRLSFFEWYDCLMARDPKALPPPQQISGDLQLLAIALDTKEKKVDNDQLGLTSLLKQFAANAVLDGHLPVLYELKWLQRTEYPKDLARLILDFKIAMRKTKNEFLLDFSPDAIDLLAEVADGKVLPDNLPKEVTEAYRAQRDWNDPEVWFVALRIDLLRLLELARKKLEPPKPENGELAAPTDERDLAKILLLVDDVHQMGAAPLLLQFFSSDQGLRSQKPLSDGGPSARADIRVVCTYKTSADLGPTIKDLLEDANGARELPLQAFQQPEDRLAYEFFLSRWRDVDKNDTPLAVDRKANKELVEHFFKRLKINVDGIPSRLKSDAANSWISGCFDMPPGFRVMRQINDEDLIKLIPEMKRGGI
jgi:hypothetical protein